MGLSDWLFGSTPGQQAGQAVKEVVGGVFDGIDKLIDDFHLEPEKALAAKIRLAEMQLDVLKGDIANVQGARAMQTQIRSKWPGLLSSVAVIGFYGGFFSIIYWGLPREMDEMTRTLVSMFATAMITTYKDVLNFWVGSTNGSQSKDMLIYNSTPIKKDG